MALAFLYLGLARILKLRHRQRLTPVGARERLEQRIDC
jgi:hypothetical protein